MRSGRPVRRRLWRKDLARIYDPFFTTKAVGQGTRLRLSTTYGVIKEHSGWIECRSKPDQGTQFTVNRPLPPRAERQSGAQG